MKPHILPAIRLTVFSMLLCMGAYPLFIFVLAKGVAPAVGRGETISANSRPVGYYRVGQAFSDDRYFWSRPSATGYNAAGSAGSNKGPSNADYLALVKSRLDTFLVHHPGVTAQQVPAELVTASGSGLDPHLSPAGARVQASRVARTRGISEDTVRRLIDEHTEGPLLGLFGVSVVNVLELNLALDQIK